MEKNTAFCDQCNEDINYLTEPTEITANLKGHTYTYTGKRAYCPKCGQTLTVPKVADENVDALYAVFREENDLIPLEQVRAIPERYAIGKRPLSLLLGWGELTFTRYYDGDIPTKQYSEIMKKIYEDPVYYLGILEANMDRLPSSLAFRKSKQATDDLIKSVCAKSKIESTAGYIIHQCEDISPFALQKLLYYMQGFYYAFYGSFLFEEDCEAWVNGPVFPDVYLRHADYRYNPNRSWEPYDSSVFTDEEKAVIRNTIWIFGQYSGKVLTRFTKSESPWAKAREGLPELDPARPLMKKENMQKFFLAIKKNFSMENPEDIHKYAQFLFACQ